MGTFLFLLISVVLIVVALSIFSNLAKKSREKAVNNSLRTQKNESGGTEFVRCPLCNTPLSKKENMHSKVFRPMNTPDQRMTVQGCPHCFPVPEIGVKRVCPVCGKNVPLDGELIARLFNRPDGKKHVMITGCTECYKK